MRSLGRALVMAFCLVLAACDARGYECAEDGLEGEYSMVFEGRQFTVNLLHDNSGQFFHGVMAPLRWDFVQKYELVELDMETPAADVLRQMMGMPRPAGVLVTKQSTIALRAICGKSGRADRLELSEDRGLEFLRK